MNKIDFALCGSPPWDDELNPYKVTEPEIRQAILSLINWTPRMPEEIAAHLKLPVVEVAEHLAALEKPALVVKVDERYKPSFAIFTIQDQERLKPLICELSRAFVKTIQESMNLVHDTYAACGFSEHGFSFDEIAYILVGAYTLDYVGLDALLKAGFLTVTREMPGGNYVFSGFEGESINLRSGWKWGHNAVFGRFTFSGHGELPLKGARGAFPEQAWIWQYVEGRSEEDVVKTMEEIGEILVALYEHRSGIDELVVQTGINEERLYKHLKLLQELEYVGANGEFFVSACPVVGEEAAEHIQKLGEQLQTKFITQVLKPNWGPIQNSYKATAPANNAIDIREAINPIYHLIFEQALQMLMDQGTIPCPKRHVDGARYAVWIKVEGGKLRWLEQHA